MCSKEEEQKKKEEKMEAEKTKKKMTTTLMKIKEDYVEEALRCDSLNKHAENTASGIISFFLFAAHCSVYTANNREHKSDNGTLLLPAMYI